MVGGKYVSVSLPAFPSNILFKCGNYSTPTRGKSSSVSVRVSALTLSRGTTVVWMVHRAVPNWGPGLRTANLSCSLHLPTFTVHSSTKRKASQRSQFQCGEKLGTSQHLLHAAFQVRWGSMLSSECTVSQRGPGEPLMFLSHLDWSFTACFGFKFFFCLFFFFLFCLVFL